MTARTFALIIGIAFLGAGVLGFIPTFVTPPPAGAPEVMSAGHGYLFGLFPINALHNLVHLAVGGLGLAAYAGMMSPVSYSRGLAVFYGALAIFGLVPGLHTLFGLVPVHGHDIWLHAGTALAAAWFGFRAPAGAASRNERRRGMERRSAMIAVPRERRLGERRGAHGAAMMPG
ncbi:MAG TPA: DUF4383 domain-containing protein [Burkholderiales bacterium]|nr:DUF4383 domain-containing protein [Burkholderiales bacterium]